ncbi:hypothetical protein ACFWXK_24990 [Streptomyces sp. NPDC059070]|uniref:hypothetical protein n=1 Tax=Streptomyces sp. NPDC059070 TaxID=3346713 RepID=UPI0036AE857B
MALTAAGTQAALAVPPPNPYPPEITVVVPGPSSAQDTSCTFNAIKPNYSGSKMTGVGGIKMCSGGPVACTSEVDLEFYNEFSRMWMTSGTSRQHMCAPPARTSTSTGTCVSHPNDPKVGWRTSTAGSFVNKDGQVGTGSTNSPVLYIPCA